MFLEEKDYNGLQIVKGALNAFWHKKILLYFVVAIQLINIALFSLFLLFEYLVYGIHIFDITTFVGLIQLSFFHSVGKTIGILSFIIVLNIITIGLKMSFSYMTVQYCLGYPPSFAQVGKKLRGSFKEWIRFGCVSGINQLSRWIEYFKSDVQLHNVGKLVEGSLEEEYQSHSHPRALLSMPLVVETNEPLIQVFSASEILLKKTFGEKVVYNFQLIKLRFFATPTLGVLVFLSMHLAVGLDVFASLVISVVVLTVFESCINLCRIFFGACVYVYCTKQKVCFFTPDFLHKAFLDGEELDAIKKTTD